MVISTQMAGVAESEETAAQLEAAAESSGTVGGNEETAAQLEAAAESSDTINWRQRGNSSTTRGNSRER